MQLKINACLILILTALGPLQMLCQNSPADAGEYFKNGRYSSALPGFLVLLKTDPGNGNINYKAGVCYLHSRSQKAKAAAYFEKAIANSPTLTLETSSEKNVPLIAYKFLGDSYQHLYKFDAAIVNYEKYREALQKLKVRNPVITDEIDRKIGLCRFGKEIIQSGPLPGYFNPENFTGSKTSATVDTPYGNYSSVLSDDKSAMIYTFKVPVDKMGKSDDSKYFEDSKIIRDNKTEGLVVSKTSMVGKGGPERVPDTVVNVTTIGSSLDGQIVLSYKDDRGEGNLYITNLKKNKWTVPVQLPKTINSGGWEPFECLSPDGNTLYFVSDRPGGYGGKDLYQCKRLPNGEWDRASNLGAEINSASDEQAPFMHPDGVTLLFSSNRDKLTHFDHYSSISGNGQWSKPIMTGYPVDKSAEQRFYQVVTQTKKITSASLLSKKELKKLQKDSIKESLNKEKDNWVINFTSEKNAPLTLLKGALSVPKGQKLPADVKITIMDNTNGQVLGLYRADAAGKYSFIVPDGKNNNISYQSDGYLFQSQNINVPQGNGKPVVNTGILLPPIAKKSITVLNNVFFNSGTSSISLLSTVELNTVLRLLYNSPKMEIEFTNLLVSNRDDARKLSQQRAEAVAAYLEEKGISRNRISVKGKSSKPSSKMNLKEGEEIQQLTMEIKEI